MTEQPLAEIITNKLLASLQVEQIEVEDQSHLHKGHAGWREGGQTHFQITIKSPEFENEPRIKCHRIINNLLKEELKEQIHALSIKIL